MPTYSPTKRVKIVKRITAREIFHRVPAVKKPLWGGALWSTGDCISPVGRHGHEAALRQSVKQQGQAQTDKPLPRHDVQLQLFCGFGVLGLILKLSHFYFSLSYNFCKFGLSLLIGLFTGHFCSLG